jgi:limonene-1,2-epoxide hydrolase
VCAECDVFIAQHEVSFVLLSWVVGPEQLEALLETGKDLLGQEVDVVEDDPDSIGAHTQKVECVLLGEGFVAVEDELVFAVDIGQIVEEGQLARTNLAGQQAEHLFP